MVRALIEILLTIAVMMVARAVLTSVLRGVARSAANSFTTQNSNAGQGQPPPSPSPSAGGDLHKDPVCGTYVAAGAAVNRRVGGQTFYYCSETCRDKHT